MNHTDVIAGLRQNKNVFKDLLHELHEELYIWKPVAERWCLLEIVCHLYDEERDDFRARLQHVLETPAEALPSSDPQGWVQSRKYMAQDFSKMLEMFLVERERTLVWLESLAAPKWENAFEHATHGSLTATMFLINWLAHDYLHIRQITKLKYDYLNSHWKESLDYAGTW